MRTEDLVNVTLKVNIEAKRDIGKQSNQSGRMYARAGTKRYNKQ